MEPFTIDLEHQHPNSIKILHLFDAYRVAYKYVDSQPIHAVFVVPKEIPSGPRPLLARFHGGGFTEGEAEASMRPFFLELALKHGAIILAPDYRLRPEHTLVESVDDVRSFWNWVEAGEAAKALRATLPGVQLDATNLLVAGESAGGFYAVQTALLGLTGSLPIRVLFLQYPSLSLRGYLGPAQGLPLGDLEAASSFLAQPIPYSVVEEHLAAREPGTICARARYGSRMHLFGAMMQAGKFASLGDGNEWIDPMKSLEAAGKLPPTLLYHSKEDEALPWQRTEEWAQKLKKLQPDVPLFLTYQTGEHVFDKDHNVATPWLKEPLEFVQKYWPA